MCYNLNAVEQKRLEPLACVQLLGDQSQLCGFLLAFSFQFSA